MKPCVATDQAQLPPADRWVLRPLVGIYEAAFLEATGLKIEIHPPWQNTLPFSAHNPFCALLRMTLAGCAECQAQRHRIASSDTATAWGARQAECFAGLTEVALPVVLTGHWIATIWAGQFFCRQPNVSDFESVRCVVRNEWSADIAQKARRALFASPILSRQRYGAIIMLLQFLSTHFAEAVRCDISIRKYTEPSAVLLARRYIETRFSDHLTLQQISKHAHLSRFHLCRIFKQHTGLTMTRFIWRVRLQKAAELLSHADVRVTDVAARAGFTSLPQFYRVFKGQFKVPPLEYRRHVLASVGTNH